MLRNKLSRTMLMAICAAGMLATTAFSQTYDKKVYFTFSGPVEVPGATLPAGKYLFHLMDPDSSRQVIQVQSADGKQVYSAFFSSPAQRPDPPDEAEVRFMESAAGSPAAISTLWYAGERTGRELIYPREQALRIAKAANTNVLTTQASSSKTDETKSGDLSRVSPTGQDTELAANAPAAEPKGRLQRGANDADATQGNTAARSATPRASTPVATAGQAPAPRTAPARSRLPQTASNTPFLLMVGACFLTAAGLLRFSRMFWM